MNLFVFPQSASDNNGYGIVVKSDFDRLKINPHKDKVIWYTTGGENLRYGHGDLIIKRPGSKNFNRFWKVLMGKPSSELISSQIKTIAQYDIRYIFCGDTIAYRALRKQFPNSKIHVRFHNCFYRIKERLNIIDVRVDLKYKQVLNAFSHLEKEIFSDSKMIPYFLCLEDQNFYETITGRNDSILWSVEVDENKRKTTKDKMKYGEIQYLIYFGGVDTHKKKSIDYFIQSTYPKIKNSCPGIQFHLFGYGTEQFNAPSKGIVGHGRYNGNGFPYLNNGLYINPDLTGGGVKIKVKSYLEHALRFISTPFGFEGYSSEFINNEDCWVFPMDSWTTTICDIIENSLDK